MFLFSCELVTWWRYRVLRGRTISFLRPQGKHSLGFWFGDFVWAEIKALYGAVQRFDRWHYVFCHSPYVSFKSSYQILVIGRIEAVQASRSESSYLKKPHGLESPKVPLKWLLLVPWKSRQLCMLSHLSMNASCDLRQDRAYILAGSILAFPHSATSALAVAHPPTVFVTVFVKCIFLYVLSFGAIRDQINWAGSC